MEDEHGDFFAEEVAYGDDGGYAEDVHRGEDDEA